MSNSMNNENMAYDFQKIVAEHQRMVYNLAYRFFGNHDDADETVQKTFMKAYEKISGFEARSSLKTWLYKIALNICRNGLREKKRRNSLKQNLESNDLTTPLSEAIDNEESKILKKALNDLPPKQKETIILRTYENLSFREIGQILKLSENSAKVNYHFGVKRLKELIRKGGTK